MEFTSRSSKTVAQTHGIPKLTMPTSPACHPRKQLYARFAGCRSCTAIWVSAPAGYGKTTAVSGFLRSHRRPVVWYNCDDGDGDIGSFFHYASLARRALLGESSTPLAAFDTAYLGAVPTFCRNYFRDWFESLPRQCTLVLDDWQDVPAASALARNLPVIVEQVPAHCQVFILSRSHPPESMSRWLAAQRLALIGTEDLRLAKSETRGVAMRQSRTWRSAPQADVDALHEAAQGWAAALTLLARSNARTQSITDYFAAEVYQRLTDSERDFMLTIACLERVTVPLAIQASGNGDAAELLDSLARQNIFLVYDSASHSYCFHPLFLAFLRTKLMTALSAQERRVRQLAAARALEIGGEYDAAIAMLLRAKEWRPAARSIANVAEILVEQARIHTVLEWIDALPGEAVTADGWMLYWRATCRLSTAFAAARADFEGAYRRFAEEAQPLGQMLACAGVLQHIAYSYLDYGAMLPWLTRLGDLLEHTAAFPDSRTELRLRAAYMLALSQAMPNHTDMLVSVERVSSLVHGEINIASRAEGVSALLHFFSRFGLAAPYGDLDEVIEELLAERGLSAVQRINLIWLRAYRLHSSGDHARVLAMLGEARALARHEGLHTEDIRMRLCELQARDIGPSSRAALTSFSELEPFVRGMPPIPRAHFLYVRALFELACGNNREALRYAEDSVALIRNCRWYIGAALALTGLAEVYCALERCDDAARCMDECSALIAGVHAPLIEFNVALVRAEIARRSADPATALGALRTAFAVGREQGFANGFHTSSLLLRRLIPLGIEHGIEPSYCRWVIEKRGFEPSTYRSVAWPWPVKIRAFGRFSIQLSDTELIFSGKAQRKPLEILKLLCARPRGIDTSRVMDELWRDLDGDAARNALDVAVHRLRKMLKAKDAVVTINSTLRLNERVVWLDTRAWEHFCADPAPRLDCSELFDLYRGQLLDTEELAGVLCSARSAFREQFVRAVSRAAKQLAEGHHPEHMASLYRRALEWEPLEPSFIRGLASASYSFVEGERVTQTKGDHRPLGEDDVTVVAGLRGTERAEPAPGRAADQRPFAMAGQASEERARDR